MIRMLGRDEEDKVVTGSHHCVDYLARCMTMTMRRDWLEASKFAGVFIMRILPKESAVFIIFVKVFTRAIAVRRRF